jgi:DNA helicase-2/ATP-dependent DNA helicase PcrA
MAYAGGRIVIVGDDRQGIYGFRGASTNALDMLKAELGADEFPLTVTRRCPKAVVSMAKALVPDFTAADDAPDGTVDTLDLNKILSEVKPGNFILSRTNAPLVGLCLKLVANDIPARVRGRNIGDNLIAMVEKAKAKDLNDVSNYLDKWEAKQMKRAATLPEEKADRLVSDVQDKRQTLDTLIGAVDTVKELISKIDAMFSDNPDIKAVMLSTVHKSKGLEADRVFLLESTFRASKGIEDDNIRYVALTRAKSHLTLVQGES